MIGRAVLVLLLAAAAAMPARAQETPRRALRGIGLETRLADPDPIAPIVSGAAPFPIFVSLSMSWAEVRSAATANAWSTLDARLAAAARLGAPILLRITGTPGAPADAEAWRASLRALAGRSNGRIAAYEIDAPDRPRPDARVFAYWLKLAAVQLRSVDGTALIAQTAVAAADTAWQTTLFDEDTAAYVDVVPVRAVAIPDEAALPADLVAFRALVDRRDPSAIVLWADRALDGTGDARQVAFSAALAAAGERQFLQAFDAAPATVRALVDALTPVRDLIAGEVVSLDERTANLRFASASPPPHRLLYNLTNFSTYLVCWPARPAAPLSVTLTDQSRRVATLRDPVAGRLDTLPDRWDEAARQLSFDVPAVDHPVVIDFNYGAADVFVSHSDVSAAGSLSVAEIVFRQQQAQAAQDRLYQRYTASSTMSQRFRASPTDVFDVVTQNRVFVDRGVVEWQELSFSVNGAKWGANRPDFPVLQAEKVLSLPLDLRLTADYRYRLAGTDTVDGRRCYVVAFDPIDGTKTLYRGRLWIDAETFARVRLNTIQGQMPAPVISSEEAQSFAQVAAVDGAPIRLPTRVSTKQLFLIAGRTLLVEKDTDYRDFAIDPPDFDAQVRAAHESPNIMFRDTDQGIRYLVTQNGQRVVSDRATTRAKAMAIGATIDPSYAYPLPILGINYLNFALGGRTDRQLALLFAGVLALGNLQLPEFGARGLDLSVDFFGIAVPSSDLVVDAQGERKDERVLNIPSTTGVNLGYQVTPFQRVVGSYGFRHDFFFHDTTTAENFTVPANGVTHGVGASYEYKRHGYQIGGGGAISRRMSTRPWGLDASIVPPVTYERYAVAGSKDVRLSTFQTIHVGAGWYGGRRLDRFSMYQFGLFDEVRMHGVPAAGVRFPELVLARASYSFNVLDQFRVDLFFDRASGRDPVDRDRWRPLTGTGAAINFRAFGNTMLRADFGKGFLPANYAGLGSMVLQIMLLKPL